MFVSFLDELCVSVTVVGHKQSVSQKGGFMKPFFFVAMLLLICLQVRL
jgi:hypothetical protein